ncbi:MAG: hypothetical protein JZU64_01695 [Rhodoferax sp.]|jgi:hypothetical protein|nr:hypothetical protein [Rhodoferax sp.]
MSTLTSNRARLTAILTSLTINLALLLAIGSGFAAPPARHLTLVQLPGVLVTGKRLPATASTVTAASANTAAAMSAGTKL